MQPIKRFSMRSWPIITVVLMSLFISYGLSLISRSQQLQQRITQEVHLLDELDGHQYTAIRLANGIGKGETTGGFLEGAVSGFARNGRDA